MKDLIKGIKKAWNFFKTLQTESVPDFISWMKGVESPTIYISATLFEGSWVQNDVWFCQIKFVSWLADGTTVLLLRKESVEVKDGVGLDGKKNLANAQIILEHLAQPIELMVLRVPHAKLTIYDLLGNVLDLVEFRKRYKPSKPPEKSLQQICSLRALT